MKEFGSIKKNKSLENIAHNNLLDPEVKVSSWEVDESRIKIPYINLAGKPTTINITLCEVLQFSKAASFPLAA